MLVTRGFLSQHPNGWCVKMPLVEPEVSGLTGYGLSFVLCERRKLKSEYTQSGGRLFHDNERWYWAVIMKIRPFLATLAIAASLTAAAMPAGAAMLIYSANYGSPSSPLPVGGNQNLSLGTFDPSLGTLTGVTISLFSEDIVESEILNFTTGNLPYTAASTAVPVTVTALNGLTTTVTAIAGPYAGMARAQSETVDGELPPSAPTAAPAPRQGIWCSTRAPRGTHSAWMR